MVARFRNLQIAHWAAKNGIHELTVGSLERSGTISFQRQPTQAKPVTFLHSAANPNDGFLKKSGFLGVPPVAHTHARTRTQDRTAQPAPAPTQEILIPWRALASPLQQRHLTLCAETAHFCVCPCVTSRPAARSQAPEKMVLHHFQAPHLRELCQARALFSGPWW